MKSDAIQKMQNRFDEMAQTVPESDVEFWFARSLQEPLGYGPLGKFPDRNPSSMESCSTTGFDPADHFRGATKLISLSKGGQRGIRPENLPPEEDIKKLERRVKGEEKKLGKQSGKLPAQGNGI